MLPATRISLALLAMLTVEYCELAVVTGQPDNQTLLVVIGGMAAGLSQPVYADDVEIWSLSTNSFVKKGSVAPSAVSGYASVLFNNTVYILGGGASGYSHQFYSYDILNNSWQNDLGKLPITYSGTAVELGGKIYLLGGETGSLKPMHEVYEYDIRLRTWSKLTTPIPETAESSSAVIAQEKYMFYMSDNSSFYRSDDRGTTWKRKHSPKELRSQATLVSLEGANALLFAGGDNLSGISGAADIYNLTKNKWKKAAAMKVPRWAHSAAVIPNSNNVLVCGGYGPQGMVWSCEVYDWEKNEWSMTPFEMKKARYHFGVFVVQAAL